MALDRTGEVQRGVSLSFVTKARINATPGVAPLRFVSRPGSTREPWHFSLVFTTCAFTASHYCSCISCIPLAGFWYDLENPVLRLARRTSHLSSTGFAIQPRKKIHFPCQESVKVPDLYLGSLCSHVWLALIEPLSTLTRLLPSWIAWTGLSLFVINRRCIPEGFVSSVVDHRRAGAQIRQCFGTLSFS